MSEAGIISARALGIISPPPQSVFHISPQATWPSIVIETNASEGEQLTWLWSIHWHTFSRQGTATTQSASWDAGANIVDLGGTLAVTCVSASGTDAINVRVIGEQPDEKDVLDYLATKPDSVGFERIVRKESRLRHFDQNGEPIRSFDNGYGIAQLTKPAPTYQQVWNWKKNIDVALGLYQSKQTAANVYLSRDNRAYTDDQLQRETICRWNGGVYHVWNPAKGWIRNPNVLCDSRTGNIGWKMTLPDNVGHTEAELHERDAEKYKQGRPGSNDAWGYFGICYADSLLKES